MGAPAERELKFEVAEDFHVPDLEGLAPASVRRTSDDLHSTYFDTEDLALSHWGGSLRRRDDSSGGAWQITWPHTGERTEFRLSLKDGHQPPEELLDLTAGLRAGKELHPVAAVRTTRQCLQFCGDDGEVMAEVADDVVHATAFGAAATVSAWREIDVEWSADERLAHKVRRRLRKAGAAPATDNSKLDRALGRTPSARSGAKRGGTRALSAYVEQQIHALVAGDIALRKGDDPIHSTRVAVRRLRSTLRVFGAVFEPAAAAELDSELIWYAGLLGEVRDREVLSARMQEAIHRLPAELVLGPVAADVHQELLTGQLHHRHVLSDAMNSERYFALMATLRAWQEHLPLVEEPTRRAVVARSEKARRKAARRLASALNDESASGLHRARKAAKRGRYATELVEPVIGKKAKPIIKHFKQAQEILGEHQDAFVAMDFLRRLGAQAAIEPGRNGFTYGLLLAQQDEAQRRVVKKARKLRI